VEKERGKKWGGKMIGETEVGCTICKKTVGQIFLEHIQEHINKGDAKKEAGK